MPSALRVKGEGGRGSNEEAGSGPSVGGAMALPGRTSFYQNPPQGEPVPQRSHPGAPPPPPLPPSASATFPYLVLFPFLIQAKISKNKSFHQPFPALTSLKAQDDGAAPALHFMVATAGRAEHRLPTDAFYR